MAPQPSSDGAPCTCGTYCTPHFRDTPPACEQVESTPLCLRPAATGRQGCRTPQRGGTGEGPFRSPSAPGSVIGLELRFKARHRSNSLGEIQGPAISRQLLVSFCPPARSGPQNRCCEPGKRTAKRKLTIQDEGGGWPAPTNTPYPYPPITHGDICRWARLARTHLGIPAPRAV